MSFHKTRRENCFVTLVETQLGQSVKTSFASLTSNVSFTEDKGRKAVGEKETLSI